MSLLGLHKPTKFADFKGNLCQIREIRAFLQNPHNLMIVSGNLATGKSTLLDIIENDLKESVEILRLTSHANYNKDFMNFTTKRSIENLIFAKKKLILIDDIHLMDKAFISLLKTSSVPVLVTCQSKEDVKIQELRRSVKLGAKYVKLNRISLTDCLLLITELVEKNELEHIYDCDIIIKTINEHKCNIRAILQSLAFGTTGKGNTGESGPGDKFMGNFMDMNIYELTGYFWKHRVCDKFISMNLTGIISFVTYENALSLFHLNNREPKNLKTYKDLLRILIENDDQRLDYLNESKYINDYLLNKRLNTLCLDSELKTLDQMKFTTVFNKLSIKAAFSKKINLHVQTNDLYCDPNVDIVVGNVDGGHEIEALYKKIAEDFKLT